MRKFAKIKIAVPESPQAAIESLLIFDARCLDLTTRQALLRLLPELTRIRRAWRAEYMECGCVACRRKSPSYGAGGFCNRCWGRIYGRMHRRYRKLMATHDIPAEMEAFRESLTLKFSAAQKLLGANDGD